MKNQPCKENNNLLNLEKKIFFFKYDEMFPFTIKTITSLLSTHLIKITMFISLLFSILSRLPCLLASCLVSYQDYHVY